MHLDDRTKKIIIISGGIALLVVLGFIVYLLFGGNKKTGPATGTLPATETGTEVGAGQTPATGTESRETESVYNAKNAGKLLQIIPKPVISPAFSADNKKIVYYDKISGNAESVEIDGKGTEKISNTTILGVFDALWQPLSKEKSILSYIEGDALKRVVQKISSTTVSFLPQTTTAAAWSPDGKQIAYIAKMENSYNLVVTDENFKKATVVYATPAPDFNIFWPSKNQIILVSRPSGEIRGIALNFDIGKKTISTLFSGLYGLSLLPSPDGNEILYNQTNMVFKNFIYSGNGKNPREVNLPTLPEKCAFSLQATSTIFCGVPKNLSSFPALPDDWYMGKDFFQDKIIKLDVKTGKTSELLDGSFDVFNIFVAPDSKYLFFQDKKDFTVWRLEIQ